MELTSGWEMVSLKGVYLVELICIESIFLVSLQSPPFFSSI